MKTKQYPISLTDEEAKRIQEAADKEHRSRANWLYTAAMEKLARDKSNG